MAPSSSKPDQRRRSSVRATLCALLACSAGPALAAAPNTLICSDTTGEATLDLPIEVLAARSIHHGIPMSMLDQIVATTSPAELTPARLLAPQAAAAIRNAFKDENEGLPDDENAATENSLRPIASSSSKIETDVVDSESVQESEPRMNTRLPGVSDDELSRFKKQMYRRDI